MRRLPPPVIGSPRFWRVLWSEVRRSRPLCAWWPPRRFTILDDPTRRPWGAGERSEVVVVLELVPGLGWAATAGRPGDRRRGWSGYLDPSSRRWSPFGAVAEALCWLEREEAGAAEAAGVVSTPSTEEEVSQAE